MKHAKKIVSVLTAAGLVLLAAPRTLWAESASPTGDAADFLAGTDAFDPNASGTKLSGTLSVVYDKETRSVCEGLSPGAAWAKDMYIGITLEHGNLRVPFTTDYLRGARPHADGFCVLTNELEQARTILALIERRAIPFFYSCDPDTLGACPKFKIKSISNFQYTAGPLSTPSSGGFSADITVAVQ